ncbi:MAG TPA: hypothetical protein VLE74_01250 [Candidatus Saccharimonadales bacterium]|nr:hypothetical protein [Candidatus Saccharimonadales bacterium]
MKRLAGKKLMVFIPVVVIVLSAAGFGVWKLFGSKKSATVASKSASQPQLSAEGTPPGQDVPDTTKTQTYENGYLGVKLTYPSTWTATESDTKDSVRLESSSFSYATVGKGSVSGYFRIYIRKGARDVDSKYIGRGYAIQPSEKLTYTQPAAGQRADTNLSLFGLDTPDNFAFFMIAGNFSLKKGDSLGPNYGKEAETFIIAGGFSSKDLKDDLATNPVAPELLQSSNAYKQAVDILKSLQLH